MEMHLLTMQKAVEEIKPSVIVIDPLTNLVSIGSPDEIKSLLVRLIDYLKMKQITAMFTSLTAGGQDEVSSEVGVSSLMDTWILVRNLENDGERNRALYVLKSRGMAHSSQVREFHLTSHGVELVDVSVGPNGVLIGSSRIAHQARERAADLHRQAERGRKQRDLERKRKVIESQMTVLQAEIEAEEEQFRHDLTQEEDYQRILVEERQAVTRARLRNGSSGEKEG
jgi:circadian clock protein KaiC